MSKYNLHNLLSTYHAQKYASAKEADKLENHPEKMMWRYNGFNG